LLQEFNTVVHRECPGVLTGAEESTSWPGVTKPAEEGGLGLMMKWAMGWMHDTLDYLSRRPIYRRYHQEQVTFYPYYAFSENLYFPLSHDEVVHLSARC